MPYCESCGNKVSENAKFCKTCGNIILPEEAVTNPALRQMIETSAVKSKKSLNPVKVNHEQHRSGNNENITSESKINLGKKPFYKGFWFGFWLIWAVIFLLGAQKDTVFYFPFMVIIVLYTYYNGIIKENSWWGESIRNAFSGKAWKTILIVLFIIFVLSRIILTNL